MNAAARSKVQTQRGRAGAVLARRLSLLAVLAFTMGLSAQPAFAAPAPVAAYSFDEDEGTVAFDSAGSHDGTLEGGATWTPEGKYGSAIDFNGTSGVVKVADANDLDLTGSFTIEAWVRPDGFSAVRPIVAKVENPGGVLSGYSLFAPTSAKPTGLVTSSGTTKTAEGTSALPTGSWSHVAFTSDGTNLRLYVNGALQATSPAVGIQATTTPVKIGKDGLTGTYFDGKIDEVRIYDAALTEKQIGTDGNAPITTGLPVAITQGTASVGEGDAILNGTVNPSGSETTYQFEYGTTTSYGSSIPTTPRSLGEGDEVAELSEGLSGLKPETTYHYRVTASNNIGTTVGTDKVFKTAANSGPFFGFQFAPGAQTNGEDMEAVARSGAKYWRLGFDCYDKNWSSWDEAMHLAAQHNIQVIATIGGRCNPTDPSLGSLPPRSEWEPQGSAWETFAYELIDHYGYWGKNGTPIAVWEFWNEPNRGVAGYAFNGNGARTADGVYYGEMLKRIATALREAQNAQAKGHGKSEAEAQISVLFGGLLTLGTGETEDNGQKVVNKNVHDFLEEASKVPGLGPTFNGVSIHPYAFKAEGGQTVAQKVEENIGYDRTATNQFFGSSKGLWITEAGWPVNPANWTNTTVFPGATPAEQASRLNELLYWVESYREADNIKSMLYYNYRDFFGDDSWDHRAGLRTEGEGEGSFRPGWYTFQEHAGAARWPVPPEGVTGGATEVGATKATATASVNPHGLTSHVQIDYGQTKSYGSSTSSQSAGYGNATISTSQQIKGLKAGTTYHYRVAVTNANGETTHGVDRAFTTPPQTETFLNENIETLNGSPGYVSVHGEVHASEELIDGKTVQLEYWKEEGGQWKYNSTHTQIVHNGKFDEWFNSVGRQNWMVKAIFPAQDGLNKSESMFHPFEIHDGYQFVNRVTGKCLDIKFEEPHNEVPAWLWDCHNPTTNGQTFILVPVETNLYHDHFQIIARNSDKCVDVHGDTQNAGEQLQQFACYNPIPSIQVWKRFGSANNGWGFEIQHSHQCMDDWESGSGNGNKIDQWPCNGTSAQGWNLKSVDAPPVTTHVNPNNPEVLHGEPGLVTFGGQIDLSGYPTGGATVHVNLDKKINGQYQFQSGESFSLEVNSSGHFERDYWGVGVGEWRVRVVFNGNTTLGESDGGYQYFTVHKGYHLVNQTSGRCLSANEGRPDNGTKILQWDCSGNPQPGDGQLITWYPSQRWPYFQIRFNEPGGNNAGPCLTVPEESQTAGVQLIEWSCLGEYAGNNGQLWKGDGGEFIHFSVLHSGQCIDDWLSSTENGNKIDQWGCNGTGAQGWRFLPVG